IRSPPGSELTRSVRRRAGTVVAPSVSTLPGTQWTSPISRFVVVSRRPPSSVLSRTLARTGRVLRLETARLTTARPRARFSCMTESFTSGPLQERGGSTGLARGLRRAGLPAPAKSRQSVCVSSSILFGPSSSSSCCGPRGRPRSLPFASAVERARPAGGPHVSRWGLDRRHAVDSAGVASRGGGGIVGPSTAQRRFLQPCIHPPRTACDLAATHDFHHWTAIWWTTPASSGASVGVDQLADRRDLPPQLVVACRLPGDLVAGVEHRGVV